MQKTKTNAIYLKIIAFFTVLVLFYSTGSIFALAADITRGFTSTEQFAAGTIVSVESGTQDKLILANEHSQNQLLGVVVAKDGALLSIDSSDTSVQVAVSGQANVLVSDLYGDIKVGDLIAESPISGVGAKARAGNEVIGIAQQEFNSSTPNTNTQNIEQSSATQKKVVIGSIPIIVSVGQIAVGEESQYGGGLKGVLSDLAGKKISSLRVVLAGFIAVITLLVLAVMISTAVKNGISATGRNPLAKPAILESLMQVMAMVILICVISLTMSYAVLRL